MVHVADSLTCSACCSCLAIQIQKERTLDFQDITESVFVGETQLLRGIFQFQVDPSILRMELGYEASGPFKF